MKATGVAGATTFGTSMAAAQEDLPTVTVDLADDEIDVGETTTATFTVEDLSEEQLEEAGGASITITVDPDVAAITEISDYPAASTLNTEIEEERGGAAESFEIGTFGGVSEGDVIATYHFEGQDDGDTDIELEAFALTGSEIDVREATYDTPTLTVGEGGDNGGEPGTGTPNVPTDLSVVEATESSIEVEWSGDANADSHNVYLDGSSEPVVETTSNSATITDLEPDTIYEIGVSAVGGGEETNTTTIEASTDSIGEPPEPVVTVNADDTEIDVGDTTTVDISLTSAPDGLTTFGVELHIDPDVVSIAGASTADGYPDDDDMFGQVDVEDDYAYIKAAEDPVLEEPGATNIHLGQIELEAIAEGTSDLEAQIEILQDEDDYDIDADIESTTLTVGEGPTDPTVSVDPATDEIDVNESTTVDLNLNTAPDGLTTFGVELHVDSDVVSIDGASTADGYPDDDDMFGQVDVEDDYAYIKAAEDPVLEEPGATNIHLGQIELTGEANGTSDLEAQIEILQDEDDYDIDADTESATLTVGGEPPETAITVDPADDEIDVGDTTTVDLGLTSAPSGLTTFGIELHVDSSVVSIAGASTADGYPDDDDMFGQVDVEDDYAYIKAAEDPVLEDPGATNIHLGQVELEGAANGTTDLEAQIEILQDEDDYDIDADAQSATLTVGGEPPETTITVDPADDEIDIGDSTTVDLGLSSAPDGLTTFGVELHVDSDVVSIDGASTADGYPDDDDMFGQVDVEDDYAYIKAAEDPVLEDPGATNIHLGQVELTGEANGTTDLEAQIEILQDEDDYDIDADTESASLTVGGEPPETTITVDPADDAIDVGDSTTVDLGLSSAPDGLTTFGVELHVDSDVVSILDASTADGYPNDDDMFGQVDVEDDYAYIKAAEDPVLEDPGATNIHLGQVELEGAANGTTDLEAQIEILQDEDDYDIDADTESASLTVGGEPPETTITVDPADDEIDVGDDTTVDIGLTSAPSGLTTFGVELHVDSSVVSIAGASTADGYPDDDDMFGQVDVEDDYAYIKAAEDPVLEDPGATNIHLGQVELTGEANGTTDLEAQIEILQDEDDYDIDADTESASLTVEGDGPTPPSTPQNLSVTDTTENSIDVSWSAVDNADSYNVYLGTDLDTTTSGTSATITGLDAGTEYDIEVTAVGDGGESSPAMVSAETEEDTGTGGDGTWDPNTLYQQGQTVEHNGETWEAKWTNQGQEPEFDINGAWEPISTEIPLQQDLAAIDATSTSVQTGERVAFSVQDTSSNQAWITDLEMDFGDGTTASGWWNAHTYDSSGTYTVTLTATDQRGRQSTDEVTINVS